MPNLNNEMTIENAMAILRDAKKRIGKIKGLNRSGLSSLSVLAEATELVIDHVDWLEEYLARQRQLLKEATEGLKVANSFLAKEAVKNA